MGCQTFNLSCSAIFCRNAVFNQNGSLKARQVSAKPPTENSINERIVKFKQINSKKKKKLYRQKPL
jgi:hypothetical protein